MGRKAFWMLMSGIGYAVLTLMTPSWGKAVQATEGGEPALNFLLYALLCGGNSVTGFVLLRRKGTIRREGRRERRYPRAVYRAGVSRLVLASCLFMGVMGLVDGAAFQFTAKPLMDQGMPMGISTLLSWAPGFILAIVTIFRRQLWLPAAGVIQLLGVLFVVVAAEHQGGTDILDPGLLLNPLVLILIAGALLGAFLGYYNKPHDLLERKAFLQVTGRWLDPKKPDGDKTGEERTAEQFLAIKAMLYNSLVPALMSVAAFVACGISDGFPRIHAQALPWMLVVVVAGQGSRLCFMGNTRGSASLNGVMGTAMLMLSLVWNQVFQSLGIRPLQLVGVAVTVLGAMVAAWAEGEVRAAVRRRKRP